MKTCPAADTLRRLLAEDLPGSEAALVEDHVEGCAACQDLLDQWTATQLPRDSSPAHELNAPHLDFLQPLIEQHPPLPRAERTRDSKPGPTACLLTPPRLANYEILGVLGQGGMSVVYRARQRNLDRLVALKVLAKPEADARELARFRAEAQALAALHHRHIVPIFEVGEQDGQPYFTLELIEGGNLSQRLRGQPQDPVAAAQLVDTLAGAIHYAHEQGIVHRDLKPANILLQRTEARSQRPETRSQKPEVGSKRSSSPDVTPLASDLCSLASDLCPLTSDLCPKIADFGLAKYLHQSNARTQSGAVLGTPSYMAPEQAQGNATAVGPAADIYALGAILYELLTGRPPFQGATPLATLNNLIHEEPVVPSWLIPGVPRDLETICLKCLEKEPARRYASALELADDLQRFLANQPIQARPSSVLYRWGKFARRNRGVVGGVLGIVAALVVGTVVAVVLALGERQARNRADANALRADRNATSALHEASRARVASAVLALAAFEYAEADQDLDAIPSDLRDWEWRHLHSRLMDAHPTVTHLPPDYRTIETRLPTGRCLVARHVTNGRLGLVDTRTGNMIRQLPIGRLVGVGETHTGIILMIAPPDAPLVLMDERGALEQTQIVMGENPGPAAMTEDCATLAVVEKGSVALRDGRTGALRRTLAGVGPLTQLVFSPDGALLAGVGVNFTVTVWDTSTGEAVGVCRGHELIIHGVAFHPKEKLLLSWSGDGTVRQWHLPHCEPAGNMLGHKRHVSVAAYSTSGAWIASGAADGAVHLWRTEDGAEIKVLSVHAGPLDWLAFEPGDTALVTANQDGMLRRWPLWMLDDPCILRGHTSYVYPVACSPDGRWIASGGWDNVIRLWDAASGKPIRVLKGATGFIASIAVSPDGTRLAARSMDGRLRIWDPATGTPVYNLEDGGLEDSRPSNVPDYRWACFLPQNVAISPDGTTVACGHNNQVRFWDLSTGREQARLTVQVQGSIRHVVFSPSGRQLAIAATEPAVCLIDRDTGAIQRTLAGPTSLQYAVSFSPDGHWLAAAGEDRVIRIWDTTTGELERELRGHTDQVFTVVFHPDGHRIASGGRDHYVRIWDPATGDEMVRLQGHSDYVFSLAFSPDGSTLISGSGDTTVRIWDTVPLAERRAAGRDDGP
jgi:eukaryotic-like serine/threonine-protein kinase